MGASTHIPSGQPSRANFELVFENIAFLDTNAEGSITVTSKQKETIGHLSHHEIFSGLQNLWIDDVTLVVTSWGLYLVGQDFEATISAGIQTKLEDSEYAYADNAEPHIYNAY